MIASARYFGKPQTTVDSVTKPSHKGTISSFTRQKVSLSRNLQLWRRQYGMIRIMIRSIMMPKKSFWENDEEQNDGSCPRKHSWANQHQTTEQRAISQVVDSQSHD